MDKKATPIINGTAEAMLKKVTQKILIFEKA
jgi:hypothetical protein